MLEYDKLDVSEGMDINKTGNLHECIICHYWYFFRMYFKFQPKAWAGCHDMTQKPMNLKNVAILTVSKNYRIQFWGMTKMNRMKNANFSEKSGQLRIRKIIYSNVK